MMNSSGTGNQPSISLLCDIMMYKHTNISSMPAIKWSLKKHGVVEVVRPGLLTHRKYFNTRASPDAIITVLI